MKAGKKGRQERPERKKERKAGKESWRGKRRERLRGKRARKAGEEELITHYFSHPHCPQENAFVERKVQTDKYELWAFREGYTVEELNRILEEWNYVYNYVRPHQNLGYLTPTEFLEAWREESEDSEDRGGVYTM